MRIYLFFPLIFLALSLQAEPKYFPIGTKWTELRLDTTKYDGWYTKNGNEWVPNYERVDYYVKDVYPFDRTKLDYPHEMYTIYCQREGKQDSLCYLVRDYHYNPRPDIVPTDTAEYDVVLASIPYEAIMLYPQILCTFGNWTKDYILTATRLYTSVATWRTSYLGSIVELGEDYFGGELKLTYTITDKGYKLIDGIGITSWDGPDCVFGPSETQEAAASLQEVSYEPRPYRTVLVHFERGGEVLYDVWPEPGNPNGIEEVSGPSRPTPDQNREVIYDLQGRKLQKAPEKGIYIQDGKKKAAK